MMMKKVMITAFGLTAALMFSRCNGDGVGKDEGMQEAATENTATDTIQHADTVKTDVKEPEPRVETQTMTYTAWPIKKVDTAVKAFKAKYTGEDRWTILALNRLDEASIKRADTLIIPDKILSDFNQYSPFPATVSMLKEVNKLVIFSYAIQAFAAYERGVLVYWGPTSMGAKIHPTPTGLFFANWKAKETISTVDDEWKLKWNFNIENKEGVGWHQYTMPGYPASHSCLRMLEKQAQWMYSWAQQWIVKGQNTVVAQGTPVIVYGAYPFGSRRPWLHLLNDPNANTITEADLDKEIQPFLQRIMEQQARREKVEARTKSQADSTM
jgi:lipoprotein-anchoring transpeptidase ErfK/SrfK